MTASQHLRGDYRDQWSHIDWKVLIISTKNFVVFIDEDGDLDWETTPAYDAAQDSDPSYDAKARNSILNDAALLEATPCSGISAEARGHFKRLIGTAISCSLGCDYDGAAKMIGAASQYVDARSRETSRFWYLSASFAMAFGFSVVGMVLWWARDFFAEHITVTGLWLALAGVSGAIGALLSVIWRSGDLQVDCSAGKDLHYLEATSRIIAGVVSGLLAGLAVKSGMILAPLLEASQPHYVVLLASIAAGTGERLAGSIIETLKPSEERPSLENPNTGGG